LRRKRSLDLSIDLTPLIDIIFILLIFFLVFSVIKKDKFIFDISLPKAKTSHALNKGKNIKIELNNNSLAFQNKNISLAKLKEICKSLDTKNKFILIIDKNTKYKNLLKILDILKENQLNNISFLTKKINAN